MALRFRELETELNGKWFTGLILAIETSCDETSVAILHKEKILSNVIVSQIKLHQQWGGVVPEAASRAHVEAIIPVLSTAVSKADVELKEISAFAATNRPGLVGALSVGVTVAKGLSLFYNRPWIGVHHLEAHLWSVLAGNPEIEPPFLGLIVSGGHTELLLVEALGNYKLLGQTLDDAAGEAFDKTARMLGLPYPGGKELEQLARKGHEGHYSLPKSKLTSFDFSFSGLKSAVNRLIDDGGNQIDKASMAVSIQNAIVDALVNKTMQALDTYELNRVCVSGGVSANGQLREALRTQCDRRGVELFFPPIEMCTDNAAMIGIVASMRLQRGERSSYDADVSSNAPISQLS